MSFGKMPVANGFLLPKQFEKEYYFDLGVAFCHCCQMVQLTELVERERMFHENYAYFSSTSTYMAKHFSQLAQNVIGRYLNSPSPFVLEIGSNDGIMLQHFMNSEIRHLGVEPSSNVAQIAIGKGVETICEFFNDDLASEIARDYGQMDAILAANVMCHIPDLHSVLVGIKLLLKPRGVFIFEDPYWGDIINKNSYDQIYDEHIFYFSLASISYLIQQHDLELIDIDPQVVHGGSMRYTVAHKGVYSVSDNVTLQRENETAMQLDQLSTYNKFKRNVEKSANELRALLYKIRSEGKRVVGYGATSKSTTIINYCSITPDLVEFISDTTPIKQGKFSPGAHIPIRSHVEFEEDYPDYALLFAWNHATEIMGKEEKFREFGGKWIFYIPELEVRS
jgi:methylation protein EvaC